MRNRWLKFLQLAALVMFPGVGLAATPGVLTTIGPDGTASENAPTFSWHGVADANLYEIYLNNGGQVRLLQVDVDACDANLVCSHNPGLSLVAGNAWWAVRAYNSEGAGAWPSVSLTHFIAPAPAGPTPVEPIGRITDRKPSFVWNAVTGATSYEFMVRDEDGVFISLKTVQTSACSKTTPSVCTYSPNTNHSRENHWWYVRALGIANGPSEWREVPYVVSLFPTAPVVVSPSGVITTATPTFVWDLVEDTKDYYLRVSSEDGSLMRDLRVKPNQCNKRCEIQVSGLTIPANKNVWFWVRAEVSTTSDWGTGMGFRYHPPTLAAPTAISPLGVITTTVPSFVWQRVTGATNFDLALVDSQGIVIQEQRYSTSICTTTTCTASPNKTVALGNAFWYVRSVSSAGLVGSWSAANAFYVDPPAPQLPSLVSPSGYITTEAPEFVWNVTKGAVSYEITVVDETGVRYEGAVKSDCSDVCRASPGATVGQVNAWWWVRSVGATGAVSGWAGPMSFRYNP